MKKLTSHPEGMNRIGEGGREQLALLKNYYARMPFNNQAFRILFEHIQKGDVPILIHCASGKDRTGVACMLILLALGVDREIVLEDYLFNECISTWCNSKEVRRR